MWHNCTLCLKKKFSFHQDGNGENWVKVKHGMQMPGEYNVVRAVILTWWIGVPLYYVMESIFHI